MCGIFGVLPRSQKRETGPLLEEMGRRILFRGPDHTGYHIDTDIGMGMNRLAILDLDQGNQPMYSATGRYCIVYNGEIYNHLDLRPALERAGHSFSTVCDTETVLKAFVEYGPECLNLFNGMFAFAVWDNDEKLLFLARDYVGIKPLYYHESREQFVFASQPKALLPCLGRVEPDWSGIAHYFSFGYVPSPHSAFSGVRKLPAGHYAWVGEGPVELAAYHVPRYGHGERMPLDRVVAELDQRLEDAVSRELLSDVPIGLFLSGGLDSSAVAYYAAKLCPGQMRSFALSFEESTHDESGDAAQVARHLGLEHKVLQFDRDLLFEAFDVVSKTLDEPFADSTVLPLVILSRFAWEEVKVVLTGWGGDEIFAGYPTYTAHRLAKFYRRLPGFLRRTLIPSVVNRLPVSNKYMSFEFKAKRFIQGMDLQPEWQHQLWMGYFDHDEQARLFSSSVLADVGNGTDELVGGVVEQIRETETLDRILWMDGRFFLEGNGLFQVDRMTMAQSLEARVPLLNKELVTWANAIPAGQKLPGGNLKFLLKEVMKPHLPDAIINKPKKGFGPPTSQWIREAFSGVLRDVFAEDKVRAQGVFNYAYLQQLMREHLQRRKDHGRKLWTLLSFQMWYDRFVFGQGRS